MARAGAPNDARSDVRGLTAAATATLAAAGVEAAAAEAALLLGHLLGVDRARLHADPDRPVDLGTAAAYRALVARRAARVPLQHLTGVQEFWSLEFEVGPDVLIPRPETEHLVEAWLAVAPAGAACRVLDLGTGSGCLAVVAARERPGDEVFATDRSAAALAIAARNAARHGVRERIDFREGDWFEAIAGLGLERRLDAILANPPYIPEGDLAALAPEVRDHEPRAALTPGPDGLEAHRRIAAEAPVWLAPGGHVVAEIGLGQGDAARAAYRQAGFTIREVRRDLAGIERIVVARL